MSNVKNEDNWTNAPSRASELVARTTSNTHAAVSNVAANPANAAQPGQYTPMGFGTSTSGTAGIPFPSTSNQPALMYPTAAHSLTTAQYSPGDRSRFVSYPSPMQPQQQGYHPYQSPHGSAQAPPWAMGVQQAQLNANGIPPHYNTMGLGQQQVGTQTQFHLPQHSALNTPVRTWGQPASSNQADRVPPNNTLSSFPPAPNHMSTTSIKTEAPSRAQPRRNEPPYVSSKAAGTPDPTPGEPKGASRANDFVRFPWLRTMFATSNTVPPTSRVTPKEWAKSIVGQEWEIYWTPDGLPVDNQAKHSKTLMDDDDVPVSDLVKQRQGALKDGNESDDSEVDEPDWYYGTVHSLCSSPTAGSTDTETFSFKVTFAGEAAVYTMSLTPGIVRPSARVWTQRTMAILMQPSETKGTNKKGWESSLPADTKSIYDGDSLKRVQENTLAAFPVTEAVTFWPSDQVDTMEALQSLQREHSECSRLMLLVRFQLFLRSRLAPIEPRDETDDADDDKNNSDPTEAAVDVLVDRLLDLDLACRWHFSCWNLIHRLFQVDRNNQQQTPVPKDVLVNTALAAGRHTLTLMLSAQDPSPPTLTKSTSSGRKRAPSGVSSSYCSPTRKGTKRQRTSPGFPEDWLQISRSESNEVASHGNDEMLDDESLLSTDTISLFVDNVCRLDRRWYIKHFSNMLYRVSSTVVASFINWEQKAQIYLGDRRKRHSEAPAVKKSESFGDFKDLSSKGTTAPYESPGGTSPEVDHVKYEDIESLVEEANHDRLLKSFALSHYVTRLVNKLASIDSFATRAWELISMVMNEPMPKDIKEGSDSTLRDLNALLDEARTRGGAIENMNPIGRASSLLSRDAIKNAIRYRAWLLDLKHAEGVRERVEFLQGVVSRFSKLPPLVSKNGTFDRLKLDRISGRVADLSGKYLRSLHSNLQPKLLDRSRQYDRNELLSLEGAKEELDGIRRLPALTVGEEMLAIRCDVLAWAEKADIVLALSKPPFSDVHSLNTKVSRIRLGNSSRLNAVRLGTRASPSVEAEILMFAKDDVNIISGPSYSKIGALHAPAAAWKERSDGALAVLSAYETSHSGMNPNESHALGGMLEIRCIDDLLNEYPGLNVDISDTFLRLQGIRAKSTEWSIAMADCLLHKSSTFDETFAEVTRLRPNAPVGILVDPSKQAFAALCEVLGWYRTVKHELCKDSVDKTTLDSFVVCGFQVIDLFSRQRGSQETLPQHATNGGPNKRLIAVSDLNSSSLTGKFIMRMTEESYDFREGSPLFFLLFAVWALRVDDFVQRCLCPTSTTSFPRSDLSLSQAKGLQRARPVNRVPLPANGATNESRVPYLQLHRFDEMVKKGEQVEAAATDAISTSKRILHCNCLQTVKSHHVVLKNLFDEFEKRRNSFGDIILDEELEKDLRRNMTQFGWLVLASAQKALQTGCSDVSQSVSDGCGNNRIRWETLQMLHNDIPSDLASSSFSSLVERVKELFATVRQFQTEVSKLFTPVEAHQISSKSDDRMSALIDVIRRLFKHPILLKVALPKEHELQAMLEKTLNFEVSLRHLLAEEFTGDSIDRAAIPEDDSMVADDGTFHLYRLTRSPMYKELRTAMAQTPVMTNAVFPDTPGLAAFRWIEQICGWIDTIQAQVAKYAAGSTELRLPCEEAKHLILLGNQILEASEDVRRALGYYYIDLTVNPSGERTASLAKGGTEYSSGFSCIRWSLFLLDALISDVARQKEWKSCWNDQMSTFESIKTYAHGKALNDPKVLQMLYEFREDHGCLYLEGLELFACPTATELGNSRKIIEFIDTNHIPNYATLDAAKAFSSYRYRDSGAVIANRSDLLASLVDRGSAAGEELDSTLMEESKNGNIRVGARALLAGALKKAADVLALDVTEKLDSFCAVKASEIENSMFELYGSEVEAMPDSKKPELSKPREEYIKKAKSLKRSMEDPGNTSLFLRIVCGKVASDELVSMSIDDLANPKIQRDRLAAREAAQEAFVLTKAIKGPTVVPPKASLPAKTVPTVESSLGNATSTLPQITRPPNAVANTAVAESLLKPAASPPMQTASMALTVATPELPSLESVAAATGMLRTSSKFGDLIKSARASGPPPPPPALVMTMKPSRSRSGEEGDSITNSNGGDRFHFTLADGKYSFFATLHVEKDPLNNINGLLPPSWNQKGRLAGAALSKFFKDKLSGGRREPVVLRVIAMTDKDAREHKKFCKDYEGNLERITMFEFDEREKEKAYLVTPKFHRDAWGCRFNKPLSSYLVYLARNK